MNDRLCQFRGPRPGILARPKNRAAVSKYGDINMIQYMTLVVPNAAAV